MAFPVTPTPAFPSVPNAAGVPNLLSQVNTIVFKAITLISDAKLLIRALNPIPEWGLFDAKGKPVFTGSSVKMFDYRNDSRVPDYPIEQGGFGSYNKVATPFEGRATVMLGSATLISAIATFSNALAARTLSLNLTETVLQSLELFNFVTPEKTYRSVAVTHISYNRSSSAGVTLISVELELQEVRIVQTQQFSQSKDPSGAKPTDGGTVQPDRTVTSSDLPAPPKPSDPAALPAPPAPPAGGAPPVVTEPVPPPTPAAANTGPLTPDTPLPPSEPAVVEAYSPSEVAGPPTSPTPGLLRGAPHVGTPLTSNPAVTRLGFGG